LTLYNAGGIVEKFQTERERVDHASPMRRRLAETNDFGAMMI
jgi:hypothetical protein